MKKAIVNMLLRIQKKQGPAYRAILFFNDIYIGVLKFFGRGFQKKICFPIRFKSGKFEFDIKKLNKKDAERLETFFKEKIDTGKAVFMMPHKADKKSIESVFNKPSHLPLGIFAGTDLVGYQLIRFLFPNKASYAIFIANDWQGKGVGTAALEQELAVIRKLGFCPYSAVSKNNTRSIRMLQKLGIKFTSDLGDYFEVKDMEKSRNA